MNQDVLKKIHREQQWLLLAALSYNTEEECLASDKVYDYVTKLLIDYRDNYPEEWQHSIYPEVFIDNQDWTFTSMHFPQNEEIAQWLKEQKIRAGVS